MHAIIEDLNWRYAVKKYDTEKKLTANHVEILKESVRLAPSSVGLQAYKVLDVVNPEIREKLRLASYNQSQITDASHLFVFCYMEQIDSSYVDFMVQNMAETRNVSIDSLNGYHKSLLNTIQNQEQEKRNIWASKQTYIALGHLLHTAAQLRVDATPIEGFIANEYDEILGLKSKGLKAAIVCSLGFRHSEDKHQHLKKVRKPLDDLFLIVE